METEEDDEMERKRLRYKGQINREEHGKRRILRLGVFFLFFLFFVCFVIGVGLGFLTMVVKSKVVTRLILDTCHTDDKAQCGRKTSRFSCLERGLSLVLSVLRSAGDMIGSLD